MDIDSRLDKIDGSISEMSKTLTAHVAYSEGLELPKRMDNAERAIRTKPSWYGLSGAITALGIILTVIFTAMKG